MKKIINYENEIKFKNRIASINSISIEDTYKLEEGKMLINFVVSGDYKINELSVNNETFKYDLPLEYELDDYIDKSTIKAEIENFEYTTVDDSLNVIVDYKINYDNKKEETIIIPSEEEINLEKEKTDSDSPNNADREILKVEKNETEIEEKSVDYNKLENDDETTILKVHVYKLGETIESIAALYNVDADLIKQYNDTTNLENKDKIIVPINNE